MSIESDILKTLTYFDLFLYPLEKQELFQFLSRNYDPEEFESALRDLIIDGAIYKVGSFYSLQNNVSLIERRIKGNQKARRLLKVAKKVGVLISWFPYIKGVAVSGSLSKNFAEENDDIDLFIITSKNRLWIARSILFCVRRFGTLIKKEKWFCMNYFVDEEMLEIPEKTIYSAIEIATLLPLQGSKAFDNFFKLNSWTGTILPNVTNRACSNKKSRSSIVKWIVERLLNNSIGDRLDDMLMKATYKRLHQKETLLRKNKRGMLVVEKHVARHDPKVFQGNFMRKYECKVSEVLQEYERLHKSSLATTEDLPAIILPSLKAVL